MLSGAAALPRPMLNQPSSAPFFLLFRQPMILVTSIMRISSRYQLRKPFPMVMRKIFSGRGSSPWPSWVIKG